jgi:hypothetical protein
MAKNNRMLWMIMQIVDRLRGYVYVLCMVHEGARNTLMVTVGDVTSVKGNSGEEMRQTTVRCRKLTFTENSKQIKKI